MTERHGRCGISPLAPGCSDPACLAARIDTAEAHGWHDAADRLTARLHALIPDHPGSLTCRP